MILDDNILPFPVLLPAECNRLQALSRKPGYWLDAGELTKCREGIDTRVGQNVGRSPGSLPLPGKNERDSRGFVIEDGLLVPLVCAMTIAVITGK